MALPEFTLRQLLEAGVHFGHQTHRWNPRMGPYIYGDRNGIHIIDLTQTVPLLDQALHAVQQTVAKGGRILFVGTKRQAQKAVADAAERSAQYYMNHRWLGGTLTNWKTVSQSIARLKSIDEKLAGGAGGLTKKERLGLEREQNKLQQSLGGIREMGGTPDMIFVIDTNKEDLAILEAKKLGIPVIAVLDFELVAGRHRLSDPGQRRRGAGHRALLRPDRPGGARRHGGADGCVGHRYRRARGRAGRGRRGGRRRGLIRHGMRCGRGPARPRRSLCTARLFRETCDVDHRHHGEGAARRFRRGDDGRQARADRDRRRHGSRHRLAAHQGAGQGREEVGPDRRRGAGRGRGEGRRRGRGRGEFRDRLRGAQLGFPGDRAGDRRGRDRRFPTSRRSRAPSSARRPSKRR